MQQCSLFTSSIRCVRSHHVCSEPVARPLHQDLVRRWNHYNDCISSQHGPTSVSRFSSITSSFSLRTPHLSPLRNLSTVRTTRPSHVNVNITSTRYAHSASNNKWLSRQSTDRFTREAKVLDLKSRAAFKLLQINEKYPIFRPGMTVVDLGYAPGSWSQVAIDLVRPGQGRVIGVDVIPVQPPKGVNGIQGDFLSPEVQARVRDFVRDEARGRMRKPSLGDDADILQDDTNYMDRERAATDDEGSISSAENQEHQDKCVDVVLSDMSAPWEITSGLWKNSISNPYRRMMNTTGNKFRDHAGSMDLCRSALYFSYETLKVGGNFVCKFYQGAEDKQFEKQLRAMFSKVHREKPESSRSESREAFFVGIKRLARVDRLRVFDEG